jgi:hypothetical protein
MPWLKTEGCECPECGDFPCDPGCACDFSVGDTGTQFDLPYFASYDVTGQFILPRNLVIDIVSSAGGAGISFAVFADAVELYASGCVTDLDLLISVPVPVGTTNITISFGACLGLDTAEWGFGLSCE